MARTKSDNGGKMPQVAARINVEQERWLQEYFKTKSAGAEFILPWAIDTFFRGISSIKQIFSASELKTIVEAYKDVRLSPENMRMDYLVLRVNDACDVNAIHMKHGASRSSLESKLKTLDDTKATALMVWAAAFWGKNCSAENMDEYIKAY